MSQRQLIVLGSTNRGKLRELQALLAGQPVEIRCLDAYPDAQPPEETALSFAENARDKATALAAQLGVWVLADDSGLCVDALGGQPGVRSARYSDPHATDERNVTKLLAALAATDDADRGAKFVCAMVLASPQRVLLEAHGTCRGLITRQPQGNNGFGYDPVFYYPDFGTTFAEAPAEAKNAVSHRGKALRALAEQLPALMATQGKETS